MLPLLIYTRVSKTGDRDPEEIRSNDMQADRANAYAKAHGLGVERLPDERDESGGKMTRPILEDAIRRIEDGQARGIIVAQLDRLSRAGIEDALRTIRRVESVGGKVIAVAENFDVDTPEGRFGRNVFLSMAEMQLDRIRASFATSRRDAVRDGIWVANHVPIGYLRVNKRLQPDPASAAKVVKAYEARAEGKPWREVGKILGVAPSGAQYVIRNRVYLGEIHVKIGNNDAVNREAHPPLVTRDLWEAAQLKHPAPPRGNSGPALLAGLIRCAGCGMRMTPTRRAYNCVPSNNTNGRCPEPASIDRARVEPYVERVTLAYLDQPTALGRSRSLRIDEAERALADAGAELAAYRKAMVVTIANLEYFVPGMEQRIEAVEKARIELGRARGSRDAQELTTAVKEWPRLSVEDRRHVLSSALDVVWVRSAKRRRLPVSERVRLVAAGFALDLHRPQGHRRANLRSLVWIDNLPGEIRPSASEDIK